MLTNRLWNWICCNAGTFYSVVCDMCLQNVQVFNHPSPQLSLNIDQVSLKNKHGVLWFPAVEKQVTADLIDSIDGHSTLTRAAMTLETSV